MNEDRMESKSQFAAALKRLGGDEQLFRELATYFIEDADELLKAIRSGLATHSAEHIKRASHSLRGLAANFDAESIVAIAGSIEEMARKGELEMGAAVADLEAEVQSLRDVLKGYTSQSATK
jgi:HPt (histidine-containing phosphotransfer) domain-containing protein